LKQNFTIKKHISDFSTRPSHTPKSLCR